MSTPWRKRGLHEGVDTVTTPTPTTPDEATKLFRGESPRLTLTVPFARKFCRFVPHVLPHTGSLTEQRSGPVLDLEHAERLSLLRERQCSDWRAERQPCSARDRFLVRGRQILWHKTAKLSGKGHTVLSKRPCCVNTFVQSVNTFTQKPSTPWRKVPLDHPTFQQPGLKPLHAISTHRVLGQPVGMLWTNVDKLYADSICLQPHNLGWRTS